MATAAYSEFRRLLRAGSHADALALAEAEGMNQGGSSFWATQEAITLTRAGHCDEAVAAADRALALAPQDAFALLARGDALLRLGRAEEALSCFDEAAVTVRVRDRARRGCLECLCRLERWERLLELLGYWGVEARAARRWRAKALFGLQRLDEAAEICRDWLQQQPDDPAALWLLADIDVRRDGLDAVVTRYRRLARIPSQPPIYQEIYASLCRRAGAEDRAVEAYAKLAASSPDTAIQRRRAFALSKAGRELEALPLMEELLRTDPADMYLHNAYRAACRRLGNSARGLAFLADLLAARPDVRSLHGRLRNVRKDMEAAAR